MNVLIEMFHKLYKAFASVLYQTYNLVTYLVTSGIQHIVVFSLKFRPGIYQLSLIAGCP
jgi:hypothetical protein